MAFSLQFFDLAPGLRSPVIPSRTPTNSPKGGQERTANCLEVGQLTTLQSNLEAAVSGFEQVSDRDAA